MNLNMRYVNLNLNVLTVIGLIPRTKITEAVLTLACTLPLTDLLANGKSSDSSLDNNTSQQETFNSITFNCIWRVILTGRLGEIPWPIKGASHYHAQWRFQTKFVY